MKLKDHLFNLTVSCVQHRPLSTTDHWQGVGQLTSRALHCWWVQRLGTGRLLPRLSPKRRPPPTVRRLGYWLLIAIIRWTAFGMFWPTTWVLPQEPLVGPYGCLLGPYKLKHDILWFYYLSHEFHQWRTCKTWRNMSWHTRSIQGISFERHGRSWTFDL